MFPKKKFAKIIIKKSYTLFSVGTNPKNPNFEHPNFGISELRTPRTYLKKYKSNSNFKGRTSNFYSQTPTKLADQEMSPHDFRGWGPFRPNLLYKIHKNQSVGHKCNFLTKRL